jgi:predicted lysophospholipase L1 biosynthesis ABC-type transport system permease subunit
MITLNTNTRNAALVLGVMSAICLLSVGLAVSWLVTIAVVSVALVRLGYRLAVAQIQDRRAVLDAEWQALDRAWQVRDIVFDAHRAMRKEAQLHHPTSPPARDE